MKKVIVIGGGAAGMMAAIRAAQRGFSVLLLEQNEKLGKKIYITGKGRCNLTNACDTEELFENVMHNPKFLYSAFYTFSNWQVIDFFEANGCRTKIERGQRVFPVSDHASDVIGALKRKLEETQVQICLRQKVNEILQENGRVKGVRLAGGSILESDFVVVAAGGCSYPSTGSGGDGFRFAKELGHHVTELSPALVPFETKEDWVKELQGLALKNVAAVIEKDDHQLYEGFGEMLFTHFGVSGPLMLSASSIPGISQAEPPLELYIDLKPALSREQLDRRILRDFEENHNKTFKNAIQKLFPSRLIPVMITLCGICGEKKIHEITKKERMQFADLIKRLPVTITGTRGFQEAIITRGGVSVREVNPSTMESKLVQGLYFAGEVLDLDALTGGFNLQIAWSTGYLAGEALGK